MTTLREVNNVLEKMGVLERPFKGKHYYYFGEGDTPLWESTIIYQPSIKADTTESIIGDYQNLKTTIL